MKVKKDSKAQYQTTKLSNAEILEFLELMHKVDTKTELAKLNETTLLDRRDDIGKRIRY